MIRQADVVRLSAPSRLVVAIGGWTLLTAPFAAAMAVVADRPWALLAWLAGPVAMIIRERPYAAGMVIVGGATIVRLSWVGAAWSDPIDLSILASDRALSGLDPYGGHFYPTGAPDSPYSYGPLGLVTYRLGVLGELIGAIGTSALLVWARSWITLAVFSANHAWLQMSAVGNNDFSVGFLLAAGLVVLQSHRRVGMVLLATASAIKPYAAAWIIPAAGYAGVGPALAGLGVSVVLWAPVVVWWGVPSYVESLRAVESLRSISTAPSWAFGDVPVLRFLAVPLAGAGLIMRDWRSTLLLGSAAFLIFLGFTQWAHHGYTAVVVPVIGLALEGRLASRVRSD